MKLQLALDMFPIEEAAALARQVGDQVDIIEVGTPFIVKEGMAAVRAICEACPGKTVLADVKIMDGGKPEATYAFEAGAGIVTVLAVAEDETIRNVVQVAKQYGRQVMADMIAVRDFEKRAVEVDSFEVDYICVHTAFDVQHTGQSPLEELKVLQSVIRNAKPAVAGGIKMETLAETVALAPEIIVVGGAISGAPDPAEAARKMCEIIHG